MWICIWSIVNVSSPYDSKMGVPELNINTTHDTDIEWKRRANSRKIKAHLITYETVLHLFNPFGI